jgi:UDP-N-acetylglucosamine--N-acetylmuramyl-(pentapeptide) pyrophosphoryl-undecaprenol N-acetylglucosamine transferase
MLPSLLENWQVLHQTGPSSANNDAEALRKAHSTWPDHLRSRYHIVEFIGHELSDVYSAAALIIGRSGAGTVAEITYLGKPSILIPLPGTGGDEQRVNASVLSEAGGAIVIDQKQATPERLSVELARLASNPELLQSMAANAKKIGKPNAAVDLTDLILSMAAEG